MKENKYLVEDMKEFGDHLIQGEFIHILLVGEEDHPDQDFFCHRGTRHHKASGPNAWLGRAEVPPSRATGCVVPLLVALLNLAFLASGGGMVVFPLESSVSPLLKGEEKAIMVSDHNSNSPPIYNFWSWSNLSLSSSTEHERSINIQIFILMELWTQLRN